MRCTHYMKDEIIRNSGEMMFRKHCQLMNNHNTYFTDITDDNIVRANIRILEKKLSIDRIEVDSLLMNKLLHKSKAYLYAKLAQTNKF